MKKLPFYIAAMAIAVGCNNNTIEVVDTPDTPDTLAPSGELVSVSLNLMPEGSDDESRVSINDNYETEWDDGDSVYAFLTTADSDGTYKYTELTYSSETELFTGDIYVGENRIYSSMLLTKGTNSDAVVEFNSAISSSGDKKYKMVSKDTITISGEEETPIEEIDVYMQNIGAIFNFDMTFTNNTTANWGNVYIQDITFGDSDQSSDDYFPIPTQIELDPTKGVEDDGFVTTYSTYNGSYNVSKSLDSQSEGKYTLEIKTYPFTIANGKRLKVTIIIYADGSTGSGNAETITTYITNNSGEDFELGRSTYSTITKTIDLGESIWANHAATDFDGGDGESAETAYQIATAEQLAYLSQFVALGGDTSNKYYKLTDDINLDKEDYKWYPIGDDSIYSDSNPFKGNFNGGGKTISGLKIDTTNDYQGLFGYTVAATIENITLSEPSISGDSYVGAICGYTDNTTISNCAVVGGSVTGSSNVGGVVGYLYYYSTATECYNTGDVEGSSPIVGGVAGQISNNSTVTGCYNTGDVKGSSSIVGGVTGINSSNSAVTACYNVGSVTGDGNDVGGVIGYTTGSITACYNAGSVTSDGNYVGGVIGYTTGSITACYYIAAENIGSYGTRLSSVLDLNSVVVVMNEAAGYDYYTAGYPSDSVLPSLMGESITF